jgi:hypothetical protein
MLRKFAHSLGDLRFYPSGAWQLQKPLQEIVYQCSFGKLVVGREKRGPLLICDQCNWCYNHGLRVGFHTIIRTRTLEFRIYARIRFINMQEAT